MPACLRWGFLMHAALCILDQTIAGNLHFGALSVPAVRCPQVLQCCSAMGAGGAAASPGGPGAAPGSLGGHPAPDPRTLAHMLAAAVQQPQVGCKLGAQGCSYLTVLYRVWPKNIHGALGIAEG